MLLTLQTDLVTTVTVGERNSRCSHVGMGITLAFTICVDHDVQAYNVYRATYRYQRVAARTALAAQRLGRLAQG
jgi:hypothetical protein